ncbi:MAG: DUF2064 domain-containing protein [Halobacteriovoraceae bacterium]|nr:DUF2064 domain-containing protein [Halobacteriovoraceae bacterium]
MAKKPLIGFSKTRLSSDIGESNALFLYESFIEDFFSRLKKAWNGSICFFATPQTEDTKGYFKNLFAKKDLQVEFYFQEELPFFARLKWIFNQIQKRQKKVFIHLTGSDIPDFPFEFLKNVEPNEKTVYIGPDSDGGYYYVGASCQHGNIFEGAGKNPLDVLLTQCKKMSLNIQILPLWSDIDSLCDLKKSLKRSKLHIPSTYACYKRLGLD